HCRKSDCPPEHQIALACRCTGMECANEQIVDAVAVDIAGAGYEVARVVKEIDTLEYEPCTSIATCGWIETPQLEVRRKTRGAPKYHVALARVQAVWVRFGRPNHQIIDTIAVDIARAAYRGAREVPRVYAPENEAGATVAPEGGIEAAQLEHSWESDRPPEHNVGLTSAILVVRIGVARADDQVFDAVAIDDTCTAHRAPRLVIRIDTPEDEAGATIAADGWKETG